MLSKVSQRVNTLLSRLLDAKPEIFPERALAVTRSYARSDGLSYEMRQAKALADILNEAPVIIEGGELIVGCKTCRPLGSPVYPEIAYEWLEKELETISTRDEQPFFISESTKRLLKKHVFPYWQDKTIYSKLVESLPKKVIEAHDAGILFHYYIDRSIGHISVDYKKVITQGFKSIRQEIKNALKNFQHTNRMCYRKVNLLKSMLVVADAIPRFAKKYAKKARKLADQTKDNIRKNELQSISEVCSWVPEYPARTFWEALQSFFFTHLALNLESNGYAISPGRFDQYMFPFFKNDIRNGIITRGFAMELLCCLWIKFNELTVAKSTGTARQSTTYNDFQNLNIGGLTPDGENAVNELSYMILEVTAELRLPQPNLVALISTKNSESFLIKAIDVIKFGFGQPALINEEMKTLILLDKGIPLEDARQASINGCVELAVPGKHLMASGGYINLAKCLELALNDGKDFASGRYLGYETENLEDFRSFKELWDTFVKQIDYFIKLKVLFDNTAREIYGYHFPVPLTSMLIKECIKTGNNFHNYGALYNTPLMCPVGLATCADSLAAIKKLVFDEHEISIRRLVTTLKANYSGENGKFIRQLLLNRAPKYGNDDKYVDSLARNLVYELCALLAKYKNAANSSYVANFIPTTTHIHFGSLTAATPDGRKADEPLSEGVSPSQGRDVNGPTSVIKSVTKLPHEKCYGTLLNQKFNFSVFAGKESSNKFAELWKTYFTLGGYHVQFNVLSVDELKEAQKHPEKFKNLLVRVAGYSDYFIRLSRPVQNEIIQRTEHCCY